MPTDPPPLPTITEKKLAELLGLDRNLLREARVDHLSDEGQTYWHLEKSSIIYGPTGVQELCRRLDLPVPAGWYASTKKDGPALAGATEPALQQEGPFLLLDRGDVLTVIVCRRAAKNPRIVFVRKKDGPPGAAEISVRVRSAEAVGIGDELRVRIENRLGVLYGPQPRSRRRIAPARPEPKRA